MKLNRMSNIGILVLTLVLLPALGCNSSSSPTSVTGGTLRVTMKDAPTDELAAVNVFISGLTVKAAGMPVQHSLPVTVSPNPVDLMSTVNDPVQLAVANVDPGDYEFIQIELDPSQSSVTPLGGADLPVVIPSTEIKVLGTFTVDSSHETTVALDFNADQSLVKRGDGTWLMNPVIVIDHVAEQ